MAQNIVKRYNGNLLAESIDPAGTMTFQTNLFTIHGDFLVTGLTTTVNSEDSYIQDNVITLNAGETGTAGITLGSSGIEIDRGPNRPTTSLRYRENSTDDMGDTVDRWEATDEGVDWYPLKTNLQDDTTPQLGGDLDVNGFQITSTMGGDVVIYADNLDPAQANEGNLILDADGAILVNNAMQFQYRYDDLGVEIPISPDQGYTNTEYNKLYAKTPGSGGTGLYFTNEDDTATGNDITDELVSRKKAIVFALIF